MKKIIFSGLLVSMLGTGAYFASQKHQRADLSEIQLANIEALATGDEGGSGLKITCYWDMEYKKNAMDLYCKTCSYRYQYRGIRQPSRCSNSL